MSYKMYVRPHLDYGDVIYHNQRANLMNLLEKVQYKAVLAAKNYTVSWVGSHYLIGDGLEDFIAFI